MTTIQRNLLLGLAFTAGVVAGATAVGLMSPRHECPSLQTALQVNDPQHTAFIAARIKAIQWTRPDGVQEHFRVSGKTTPNQRLALKLDEPLVISDDHGQTELRLVEVADGNACIAYISRFDHLSFGKNLVTVDGGIVHLNVQADAESLPAAKNDKSRQAAP